MKQKCLLILLALCLLLPAARAEDTPTAADCAGTDYTVNAVLTSSGLRAALTVTFKNTGKDVAVLLVRNVALDGECTDTSFTLEAAPGRTARKRVLWQKEALGSLTAVEVWAEVSREGAPAEQCLLSIFPLGEQKAVRRFLSNGEQAVAAYDDQNAGVFFTRLNAPSVLKQTGLTFEWYLLNKSDRPMRFVLTALGGDQAPTVCDVLPHTVAYVPDRVEAQALGDIAAPRVTFRAAGYLTGSDLPLFQTEYELNPSAPRSVPTVKPTATPGPYRIGTVTIRKSGDVNVREEDSTKSRKLGSAKAGTSYPCYGVSKNGWFLIELPDGTRGYVTNSYATLIRD